MNRCSTYQTTLVEGRSAGRAHGLADAACQEARKLLVRQARKRFGPERATEHATLDALGDLAALEALACKLVDANSWQEWLRDVVVPPAPSRAEPEYMRHYEFDPGKDNLGVDSFIEVKDHRGNRAVIHIRMQSQYEPELGKAVWKGNEKVRKQHRLPVSSVVILLHEGADGPGVTGEYAPPPRAGRNPGTIFRYSVSRAWEKTPGELLSGGLGTLPLAPMSNLTEAELPEVIRRMEEIIGAQAKPEDAAKLWLSTYFFMGLRYPAELIHRLLANVMPLVRSTENFKGVLAKGYVQGVSQGMAEGPILAAKTLIRAQGEKRFGPPDARSTAALEAANDQEHLERLTGRLLEASAWPDLLAADGAVATTAGDAPVIGN